ncbi:MAG: DUF819 family protein [Firmicutes bacterium]|nr:DUF819 family protein [Bacillota bacterium]
MNPVVLLIPFYFLFPVLVIYLCYRFPLVNKIGAVILCYLAGMLVGNFLSLPPAVAGLQDTLSSAVVALALPLLLFSMDVRAWFRLAGKSTLCMLLATIAIIVVAFGGFLIIRDKAPYAWQLGGDGRGAIHRGHAKPGGNKDSAACRHRCLHNHAYIRHRDLANLYPLPLLGGPEALWPYSPQV